LFSVFFWGEVDIWQQLYVLKLQYQSSIGIILKLISVKWVSWYVVRLWMEERVSIYGRKLWMYWIRSFRQWTKG